MSSLLPFAEVDPKYWTTGEDRSWHESVERLASRAFGFKGVNMAKPKQLSRKFVETSGLVEVAPNRRLRITFDRRSHNPILREAALDKDCRAIPWLKQYRIEFDYQ